MNKSIKNIFATCAALLTVIGLQAQPSPKPINNPSFQGTMSFGTAGNPVAMVVPPVSSAGTIINVASYDNTFSISTSTSYTYSNATPTGGTRFGGTWTNTGGSPIFVTFSTGTTFSYSDQANITGFWILAGGTESPWFGYDSVNSRFVVWNTPVAGNSAPYSIASAATTSIQNVPSANISITGTTTITSFGAGNAGATRNVTFTGILTLTYNATSLIVPTSANITTAAGDYCTIMSLGGSNWVIIDYMRANGTALAGSGGGATLGANTFTDKQTITQASANHGIIASTGYSETGSDSTNMIDLAGTWNTSGTPTGIKVAITNTASGAGSFLINLLGGASGTTSEFSVTPAGIGNLNGSLTTIGLTSNGQISGVSNANSAQNNTVQAKNNASSGTAATQGFTATNATDGVYFAMSSTGFTGSITSGSPTGVAAGLATTTAKPIYISAGTTYEGGYDQTKGWLVNNTVAGGTGAQTQNTTEGTVQFAGAATSLVVTNSMCSATSRIYCQLQTNDATAVLGGAVAGSGSFTINMKTAPTGTTVVAYQVHN